MRVYGSHSTRALSELAEKSAATAGEAIALTLASSRTAVPRAVPLTSSSPLRPEAERPQDVALAWRFPHDAVVGASTMTTPNCRSPLVRTRVVAATHKRRARIGKGMNQWLPRCTLQENLANATPATLLPCGHADKRIG